ncbi:MAG: flagellar assembly protein FliH [Gammaproteobacteria bacterium]|nr:flagellar assembly protein FliH [Gammaproteobacteria bacterium]
MSNIIKSNDVNEPKKWERPEFFSDVEHSSGILSEHVVRNKNIVSDDELKRIYEQARQEGYAHGTADGLEQGRKQADKERRTILNIIDHFINPLKEVDDKLEEEIVNLSIAIARQIIRREFKTDPKHIVGVVREAIASLPPMYSKVSIYLNPADAEIVREIYAIGKQDARIELHDDLSVERGGCRVETEESLIDASIENRIATIAAELLGGEREHDARNT